MVHTCSDFREGWQKTLLQVIKDNIVEVSCTIILTKYECPCEILGTLTHKNTYLYNHVLGIYVIFHVYIYIYISISFINYLWCSFKHFVSINICNVIETLKKVSVSILEIKKQNNLQLCCWKVTELDVIYWKFVPDFTLFLPHNLLTYLCSCFFCAGICICGGEFIT